MTEVCSALNGHAHHTHLRLRKHHERMQELEIGKSAVKQCVLDMTCPLHLWIHGICGFLQWTWTRLWLPSFHMHGGEVHELLYSSHWIYEQLMHSRGEVVIFLSCAANDWQLAHVPGNNPPLTFIQTSLITFSSKKKDTKVGGEMWEEEEGERRNERIMGGGDGTKMSQIQYMHVWNCERIKVCQNTFYTTNIQTK